MNQTQYARSKGAVKVELHVQRRAIYASTTPPVERESVIIAWRLQSPHGTHYYWNQNTSAHRRHGEDFMSSNRARWDIWEEREL